MKKIFKGYLLGFLSAAILVSGVGFAANTTTLYGVVTNGIKLVVDGQQIIPTDANGNRVEPFIHNGTTYLPVRAVASALGKEVYWEGPNYTVYLGKMNGSLDYASKELSEEDSIGYGWFDSYHLKDNYGNIYSRAMYSSSIYGGNMTYEYLCNYKYSRLKGTIYVANGFSGSYTTQITIKTDGKTVYTSPEISKASAPIPFDINITGCNDLEIIAPNDLGGNLNIGELGLSQ